MAQVLSPVLVGRAAEQALLETALDRAGAGHGAVVALVGEPGVGKSRLAREASDAARRRRLLTLSGRATPAGGPFRVLSSALLPFARDHALLQEPELDPFRPWLGALVPEWGRGTVPPVSAQQVPLLAESVLRLLRVVAPGGALLVLEDLHWAGMEVLEALDHVADTVAAERLVCLVTMRLEEPSAAGDWLARSAARRTVSRLDLLRLGPDHTAELARACLGASALPAELTAVLVDRADGLPLLVEDLLAGLVADRSIIRRGDGWHVNGPLQGKVPTNFTQTVQARLVGLDRTTREVLAAAAVLGRGFDWSLLGATTGHDDEAVLGALRQGVESQILTTGHGAGSPSFGFRHALTRDVVLACLLPPERAALARAAAAAVEAAQPDLSGEWCELAAQLHLDAGSSRRAASLLMEQGRRALARGALASARAALRRARATAPDAELAADVDAVLTEVLALQGDVDGALRVGEALLTRLGPGDDRRRTDLHLRCARAAATAGAWQRARPHLAMVTAASGDDQQLVRAEALNAVVDLGAGDLDKAEMRARAVLGGARQHDLWDVVCETLEVLGRCARPRDSGEAERAFREAYTVADAHGLDLWRVRGLHELGVIDLFETGRPDRLRAAAEIATRTGALVTAAHIDLHLGLLLAHSDEVTAARASLERTVDLAGRLGLHGLRRVALSQLGYALALAGAVAEAEQRVSQALEDGATDEARALAEGLAGAFLKLLDDDRRAAIGAVDGVVPLLRGGTWPQWGLRALLRAVEDDRGEQAVAEAVQAAEGAHAVGLNRAYLGFARAVLAGRAGRAAAAEAEFAAADTALGWQVAHRRFCWRQVAEAALTDGWGEPIRWLRLALAGFEDCGAEGAAAGCRRLLERAGAPVPRRSRAREVPQPLRALGVTDRESEVLHLVASGLSNPQIAERLHLSRRTVETHVARLLAKTGAPSRVQLRTYVSRSP